VRLTSERNIVPSAVYQRPGCRATFFGELCLAGYPLRVSTAVALAAAPYATIKKKKMLQMLSHKEKDVKFPDGLSDIQRQEIPDHRGRSADSSAEQRLARVSCASLNWIKKAGNFRDSRPQSPGLAEMVGTTRSGVICS